MTLFSHEHEDPEPQYLISVDKPSAHPVVAVDLDRALAVFDSAWAEPCDGVPLHGSPRLSHQAGDRSRIGSLRQRRGRS